MIDRDPGRDLRLFQRSVYRARLSTTKRDGYGIANYRKILNHESSKKQNKKRSSLNKGNESGENLEGKCY